MQYLVGASIAIASGVKFNPGQFAIGLLLVFTIQLMVHFSNEYFDRKVDSSPAGRRTWFTGGSGVLSADELDPATAILAAKIWAFVSLILLVFISLRTPWLAVMGVLVLLTAWFYSAPPVRLVGRGVGSMTASVILCFFVPLTGLGMQTQLSGIPVILAWYSIPMTLISIALLIAFEFPDMEADAADHKRTLTVRLGMARAARVHHILIAAAFIFMGVSSLSGWTGAPGRFVLLALPLALWQIYRVSWQVRHPHTGFNILTLGAVSLFGLTGLLWLLGFRL